MAAITDLTTLATTAITSSDYLPVYDASANTDKKTPLFTAGTWTPTLRFGNATTGITYSLQVGTYTRIGQLVSLTATITLTSKGSATGSATITGLPYTSLSNASSHLYAGAGYWRSMAANGYTIFFLLPDNSSTISMYLSTASANTTTLTDTHFGNSSEIQINLIYEAAVS